jgi:hypothetical protein
MSTIASVILLLGRIFFVAMFVVSAWGNVVNHQRYVTLTKGKLPVLDVFRPGPAPDPSRRLYRNVSLLGATLALFALFTVAGPRRFAITGSFFNLR